MCPENRKRPAEDAGTGGRKRVSRILSKRVRMMLFPAIKPLTVKMAAMQQALPVKVVLEVILPHVRTLKRYGPPKGHVVAVAGKTTAIKPPMERL